jgi:hypothetical protein
MTDGNIKQARLLVYGTNGSEEDVTITGDFHVERLNIQTPGADPEVRFNLSRINPEQVHTRQGSAPVFFGEKPSPWFNHVHVSASDLSADALAALAGLKPSDVRPNRVLDVGQKITIPADQRPLKTCSKQWPSAWEVAEIQWNKADADWYYLLADRAGHKSALIGRESAKLATKVSDWPYRGGDFVTTTDGDGPYKLIRRVKVGDPWNCRPTGMPTTEAQLRGYGDGAQLWILENENGDRHFEWSKYLKRAEVVVEKTVKWVTPPAAPVLVPHTIDAASLQGVNFTSKLGDV